METADLARSGRLMSRTFLCALAWTRFQPRTVALASALGGAARFFGDGALGGGFAARPLSYLGKAVETWRTLSRDDPEVVLVITPPVFAPLIGWLWSATHGRKLVVDCHTGAFHSRKWAWARPLHRLLLGRADAVLLHTAELVRMVEAWGAPAMLLPDDVPDAGEAAPVPAHNRPTVLVAGSFDGNEPVECALDAARLMPDFGLRFTGDPRLLPEDMRRDAPSNVVLTGYLPYRQFLGEMLAADVVAVFSSDPRIMNRAAFEAVGLGKPLVLSDLPALKTRFSAAATFCPNEPRAMAEAMVDAIRRKDELTRLSVALQENLRSQRREAVESLQAILERDGKVMWRRRGAS